MSGTEAKRIVDATTDKPRRSAANTTAMNSMKLTWSVRRASAKNLSDCTSTYKHSNRRELPSHVNVSTLAASSSNTKPPKCSASCHLLAGSWVAFIQVRPNRSDIPRHRCVLLQAPVPVAEQRFPRCEHTSRKGEAAAMSQATELIPATTSKSDLPVTPLADCY